MLSTFVDALGSMMGSKQAPLSAHRAGFASTARKLALRGEQSSVCLSTLRDHVSHWIPTAHTHRHKHTLTAHSLTNP